MTNEQLIQQFYLAYYGRPADPDGLDFWLAELDAGGSIDALIASFGGPTQAEFVAVYGSDPSPEEFFTIAYGNILNRDPDAEGLAFWLGVYEAELERLTVEEGLEPAEAEGRARAVLLSEFISGVENGSDQDQAMLANQVSLGMLTTSEARTLPDSSDVSELINYVRDGAFTEESIWQDDYFQAQMASIQVFQQENGGAPVNFTLREAELFTTEVTRTIEERNITPVVTTATYWGDPDNTIEVGDNVTFVGAVPVGDLLTFLDGFLADRANLLELLDIQTELDRIIDITIAGAADPIQDDGLADDGVVINNGGGDDDSFDDSDVTVNIDEDPEGDYRGEYDITVTLADGNTTTAQINLSAQDYQFILDLLYVDGNPDATSRLFEKTTTIYPQVPVLDADGEPLLDIDGNPITYSLETVEELVDVSESEVFAGYQPIVLTTTANNGGTFEEGFTTAGDETIVAGRLDLLHQAYIDGGFGVNTLEIDAKGYFAQPAALYNIQHVKIENLPNIYTYGDPDAEDGPFDPFFYAREFGDFSNLADAQSDNQNSIIDLTRANSIESLTVTESLFQGLQDGSGSDFTLGTLTVAGIRNGAETILDGDFTQNVYLNYGELQGDGLDLVFNNLSIGNDDSASSSPTLFIAHNAESANIEVTGDSYVDTIGGGLLREITITGDSFLEIGSDAQFFLRNNTPVVIDASANTGGIDMDIGSSSAAVGDDVTFLGSTARDLVGIETIGAVTVEGGEGDNRFDTVGGRSTTISVGDGDNRIDATDQEDVTVTAGAGDNKIEAAAGDSTDPDLEGVATVTAGDGDNDITVSSADLFTITAGDGDNRVEATGGTQDDAALLTENDFSSIALGDGENEVDASGALLNISAGAGFNTIDVTSSIWTVINAGDGGNNIAVDATLTIDGGGDGENGEDFAGIVDVTVGDGNDSIEARGGEIRIASGGGNDSLTLVGFAQDYAASMIATGGTSDSANLDDATLTEYTGEALLDIDTGPGSSTIRLGAGDIGTSVASTGTGNIIAREGSVITGEDVSLFVDTFADLRAATLENITSIVLDDDSGISNTSAQANDPYNGQSAVLTLTSDQFMELGPDIFSVEGSQFNTIGFLNIIVTDSMSATDLGLDGLSSNIDVFLELQDGVEFDITAQQLHTRIAREGISLEQDGNTDQAAGFVTVTGGGLDFDPFNTNDAVQTVIGGSTYFGGSLSNDFGGPGLPTFNVAVESVVNGYDRPADAEGVVAITLDSTGDAPLEQGPFSTWHSALEIIGDQDIIFPEFGTKVDGEKVEPVELAMNLGDPAGPYFVDFSALEGNLENFTLGNFQVLAQGGGITGNSPNGYTADVQISIAADDADESESNGFGWDEDDAEGLKSTGVAKYTVVEIEGPTAPGSDGEIATIELCDCVEDLETFAFRGNWNDRLVLDSVAWGIDFELQGGTTKKADGPTGSANVGEFQANFEFPGADAVVDLVHSVEGDTRPIYAAGIDLTNASSLTINSEGPGAFVEFITADGPVGNSLTDLTVTGMGDVVIGYAPDGGPVPTPVASSVDTIDVSGVMGGSVILGVDADMAADFELTYTGSDGLDQLWLTGEEATGTPPSAPSLGLNDQNADHVIDGGPGGVILGIVPISGDDPAGTPASSVSLYSATLTNVSGVIIGNGAEVEMSVAQAAEIGPDNFSVIGDDLDVAGDVEGFLALQDLNEDPFSLAAYTEDLTVSVVTVVAEPEVTLHPDTDLTGVGGLQVYEGTTLNLTLEQFQQLTGAGMISAIDDTGAVSTSPNLVTVNITDATQADVVFDEDGDGESDGLDLSEVESGINLTLTAVESLEIVASDDLGEADVVLGDDMTLTVPELEQIDGRSVTGGTNSGIVVNDLDESTADDGDPDTTDASSDFSAGDPVGSGIDASGFDVDTLTMLNVLAADLNVDNLFYELPERVTKVITTGIGFVDGVTQTVIIANGTTVPGFVAFNRPEADTEIRIFNLELNGGTEISGSDPDGDGEGADAFALNFASSSNEDDQVQADLQEINITSTGTTENFLTGETANVIDADITSQPVTGANATTGDVANDLLTVNIDADQVLEINGSIIFESVTGNDTVVANDDDEATATLNVTGSADVTIADLDTSDDDVDSLDINHTGTGTLTVGLSTYATVDEDDLITWEGSPDGMDIGIISSGDGDPAPILDLSDDVLNNVDQLVLNNLGPEPAGENPTVVLTIEQFGAIDVVAAEPDVDEEEAGIVNLVGLGAAPFDATGLNPNVEIGTITIAPGDITLDPTTNLTGVAELIVPEGGSLTLTAAQYQQLAGSGTITGIDADGDPTSDYTVNITTLTQADVDNDLNGDGDSVDTGENLDLSGITADTQTLALDPVAGTVELNADDVLGAVVEVLLADNESIGLATFAQADGLTVTGGADTDVFFRFMDENGDPVDFASSLDASGYSVTNLHALNTFVGGFNVEFLLDDLDEAVELIVYFDPENLGMLNQTNRVVTIEPGTEVGSGTTSLAFNDLDLDDEVVSVTLNVLGGVVMDGALRFGGQAPPPDTAPANFEVLNIFSSGAAENRIEGDITTLSAGPFPPNNLLEVNIDAATDLIIGTQTGAPPAFVDGTIFLNNIGADPADATVSVTGAADVWAKAINTASSTGAPIASLTISNAGPGVLTIAGGSDSLELDGTSALVLTGDGDIVLDTNEAADNNGIDASDLTGLDASGHTGMLTLGVIEAVSSTDFEFTSGTGTTTLTLDEDSGDPELELNADTSDPANETGWTFDMSNAGADSELRIGNVDWTMGPLNIDLGPNTTLYIDEDTDWSALDLNIMQNQPIVLADDVTLTLTADQASGLNIVEGPETDANPGYGGQVVINNLGEYPDTNMNGSNDDAAELIDYDFSGIAVPAVANLFDNDVTISGASDLGDVAINLTALSDDDTNLSGQIIRFSTEEQAARTVNVLGAGDTINSSSVAWLFDSVTGQVDTSNYDGDLGRLWVSTALVDSVGGDVENLFNTLPSTILRLDFNDVVGLDILLSSLAIDRIIEATSFTSVNNITEIDDDELPQEEHIRSLTFELGGETDLGDVLIGDVVARADTDPNTPEFTTLTFSSRVALEDGHFLATEAFSNDNDGTPETGESSQPDAVNTVGDIDSDNTVTGIDLVDVRIDTWGPAWPGTGPQIVSSGDPGTGGTDGADFVFGTLTFETDVVQNAELDVDGVNNVTGKAVDASDVDIGIYVLDAGDHTGVFNLTGGSPSVDLGTNEGHTVITGGDASIGFEYDDGEAGNDGDEVITISYLLNGEAGTVEISDATAGVDIDFSDADAVEAEIAARLNALEGVDASSSPGGNAEVTNDGASAFSVTSFTVDAEGGSLGLTGSALGWGAVLYGTGTDTANGVPYAGVLGLETSNILVQGDGVADLGTLIIDGSDDDTSDPPDGTPDQDAFTLTGNGAATTIARLGPANADGVTTSTLEAESTWRFDAATIIVAEGVSIGTDAVLAFQNGAVLRTEGAVDLTEVILDFDATSSIEVPEGTSLTLTVEQVRDLDALGISVTGSGTVFVTGDATNEPAGTFDSLQTVGIDFSGITIDDAVDATVAFEANLLAAGAVDDDGEMSGFTVLGSPNDDFITGSSDADTFTGGEGDDTFTGAGGDDTYNVDSGTDTILDLMTGDVLVVDAAATAVAANIAEFVATADTVNEGTVQLSTSGTGTAADPNVIDMTLAGGANGFEITGGDGADQLTGSDQDDVINGGGSTVVDGDDVDTLTGNEGDDLFVFDLDDSSPFSLDADPVTSQEGEDRERIEIGTFTAADFSGGDETIEIDLRVNSTQYFNVAVDLSGIDGTSSQADVAAAIVAALESVPLAGQFTASVETDEVLIVGNAGVSVEVDAIDTTNIENTTFTPAEDSVADTAQVTSVFVDDSDPLGVAPGETATAGETYDLDITSAEGTNLTINAFTAAGIEDEDGVATGVAGIVNGVTGLNAASVANAGSGEVEITDDDADNGGFTVTAFDATAAVNGTGASVSPLTGTFASEFADQITDFTTGDNSVAFVGMDAGTGTNFDSAAEQASYADAFAAASLALDGTVRYFLTSTAAEEGLLFVDAAGDGTPDGLVQILGVSEANFAFGDIAAG